MPWKLGAYYWSGGILFSSENLAELCSFGWKVAFVNYGQETTGQDHLELAKVRE